MDDSSAYGLYLSKLFIKSNVYNNSNFNNLEKLPVDEKNLYVFMVSDPENIKLLKNTLNASYKNVLICSDTFNNDTILLDIPFEFVSLKTIKYNWIKQILVWMFQVKKDQLNSSIKSSNNPYIKFLKKENSEYEYLQTAI